LKCRRPGRVGPNHRLPYYAAMSNDAYLAPGKFVDSDAPSIVSFAGEKAGDAATPAEKAKRLFYAVRDGIYYDPYVAFGRPETYRASRLLEVGRGFCIPKAALLAASARVLGIPARVGFADVRNHLASPRLIELMGGTDIFTWHGYAELLLNGRWVKVTPSFNASMCAKFRVKPLEFDGVNDSLLHPFDEDGRRHMDYVRDRGSYADVPFDEITTDFQSRYCKLWGESGEGVGGDFQKEAAAS
jgi:transglutaminase-like putative cysteine protease